MPSSVEPSLRAKRGNLVGARNATVGMRSPHRFPPRDDKMGTRAAVSLARTRFAWSEHQNQDLRDCMLWQDWQRSATERSQS